VKSALKLVVELIIARQVPPAQIISIKLIKFLEGDYGLCWNSESKGCNHKSTWFCEYVPIRHKLWIRLHVEYCPYLISIDRNRTPFLHFKPKLDSCFWHPVWHSWSIEL